VLIHPHILSLITTHRCTAACDHCCFACTPHKEAAIPVPHLHEYIDQAKEVPSLRVVVFTGGECFLLGKHLDELVLRASRHGLRTRFVSNGYWAASPRIASQRLGRLVENGLAEANFSTGDMHAKYVRPECVVNGAVASAEMGLPVVVMVETFDASHFDFNGFVEHPRLKPLVESGQVVVKLSPWMKFTGKAKLDYTSAYLEEVGKTRFMGCATILNVLAINPDEHLIACCGLTLEEIEEVHLGSLREKSIAEILHDTPDDFIKIWIHLQGPDAIIRYAQSVDPTIRVPANMAHICEACRFMYHHPKLVQTVLENPPPDKDDLIRQYVMALFQPITDADVEMSATIYRKSCSVNEVKALRAISVA
jgi:hypothetical protein